MSKSITAICEQYKNSKNQIEAVLDIQALIGEIDSMQTTIRGCHRVMDEQIDLLNDYVYKMDRAQRDIDRLRKHLGEIE